MEPEDTPEELEPEDVPNEEEEEDDDVASDGEEDAAFWELLSTALCSCCDVM